MAINSQSESFLFRKGYSFIPDLERSADISYKPTNIFLSLVGEIWLCNLTAYSDN
jgi:hypothetical protein